MSFIVLVCPHCKEYQIRTTDKETEKYSRKCFSCDRNMTVKPLKTFELADKAREYLLNHKAETVNHEN